MEKLQEISKDFTILYVEDEKNIRDEIASFLILIFKSVYVSNNGASGIEAYHKFSPDIILTDIQMPVKTGLEMAKEIRDINKDIPIVIITAFNETQMLMDSIDIGINKYLIKPLQKEKMIESFITVVKNLNYKKEKKELELKERDKLAKLASSDILTGLPNNIMYKMFLNKQYTISKRYNQPLCVIKFIINEFKNLNNILGSKKADKLIVEFTKLISLNIRESDLFARIYGVEFVIVLTNNDLNEAKILIRKLKNIIQNNKFKNIDDKITVSFSGVELEQNNNINDFIENIDISFNKVKNNNDSIEV